jgi:hypothetical protein
MVKSFPPSRNPNGNSLQHPTSQWLTYFQLKKEGRGRGSAKRSSGIGDWTS